jgi:hypothetical protein
VRQGIAIGVGELALAGRDRFDDLKGLQVPFKAFGSAGFD